MGYRTSGATGLKSRGNRPRRTYNLQNPKNKGPPNEEIFRDRSSGNPGVSIRTCKTADHSTGDESLHFVSGAQSLEPVSLTWIVRMKTVAAGVVVLFISAMPVRVQADPAFAFTGSMAEGRVGHTATLLPTGKVLVAGGSSGGEMRRSAELYDPTTGVFSFTGSLRVGRKDHSATLLRSGIVLIAGGSSRTIELYDPIAGTFSEGAGSLQRSRSGHTATLLPNGMVLLVGGCCEAEGSTAELFDPASRTSNSTGSMATGRWGHTAVLLPDGKVLVAGGWSNNPVLSATSAEVYDPSSGTFSAVGGLAAARMKHSATLLQSGLVLLAGGADAAGYPTAAAELYDPLSGTSSATSPLSLAMDSPTATLLPSGKVFLVGASPSAELYDPASGTFAGIVHPAGSGDSQAATLLPSGRVLLTGGTGNSGGANPGSAEIFDPATGTFSLTGNVPLWPSSQAAALLLTGQVLIVASNNQSGPVSAGWLYDPLTGVFSDTNSLPAYRDGATATLLSDGKVLIAGGGSPSAAGAELFDPATSTFSAVGPLSTPRLLHTASLLPSGKVLIAGGFAETTFAEGAELFDPDGHTFLPAAPLATPRLRHTATLLRTGKVMIIGGSSSDGTALKSVEVFDPATGRFTAAGQLLRGRESHTATLLPSGLILVAGGSGGGDTAELYDPVRGESKITGSMGTARMGAQATLLRSGRVLISGGVNGPRLSSADVYDPATGRFTPAGSMSRIRSGHVSVLLFSGQVLIVGGTEGSSLTEAELFEDIHGVDETWRPVVLSVSAAIDEANPISALGDKFTGFLGEGPEGSCGGANSSPTNFPMLQLRRLDNEETLFVPMGPTSVFSSTTLTSGSNWVMNPGPTIASVVTSGRWSVAVPTSVICSLSISEQPQNRTVNPGSQAAFSVVAPAAVAFQWQVDPAGNGAWTDIPNATSSSYTTPPVSGIESGARYRARLIGNCTSTISDAATLIVSDSVPASAVVTSPSGGEYWLISSDGATNSEVVAWEMSDNIRICSVRVALLYSDDGGAAYSETPSGGGLPATFGPGGTCTHPGEATKNLTYAIPTTFPSGKSGSLYKIQAEVTDQAGNITVARSANPFYIVQSNPDSVRTLVLANVNRMITHQGISPVQADDLRTKLQELAHHPRVQGVVVDLGSVTSLDALYTAWDTDPSKGNDVLFGPGGIHDHLRVNLLPAYSGVKYIVLVGDDRIIPMARVPDRTALLPESTYADVSSNVTVGHVLAAGEYLTDDPLAVLDAITTADVAGNVFLPDLAVGRLVETPQEIITTIATYIGQDGILDLSPSAVTKKVLVTGYDFLSNVSKQIASRWASSLGASNVDDMLVGGNWSLGSVDARTDALRSKLLERYGLMSISGHATHYEEGVPGTDPFDIRGLSTANIYGADACSTPTAGAIDLSGTVIYAVGCHGGLSVPGSCRTDINHSLDLPQTMMARGSVAYIANSGYGWGLRYGIGYSARLVQIFTEQMSAGGTIAVGDAIRQTKQRYFIETPRHDPYDDKSVMQWTLYGLPMYAVKTGIAVGSSSLRAETQSLVVEREATTALPASLTQLNLSFDFTGANVYTKYDSSGTALPAGPGCPDANGCYYTLNGLVDRSTGSGDLPIQPYLVYDSRLSGTSQHGVLWKGGTYEEESNWKPIIAELVSNGGDSSNHGSLPRQIMLRPTAPRVVPGADPPGCRASDLELNSLTVTVGEALKNETSDLTYSIARRYRNVDLEVFYFNNRNAPTENCDRTGPSLGTGPYHQVSDTTITWAVPASDPAGVWRVLVVYNSNTVDGSSHGRWTPLDLTDDGSATFRGSADVVDTNRLTYVVQAVDHRGNVTWLDYVTTQLPASGVAHGIPQPVDVTFGRLTAPANVLATAATSSSVSVTWDSVSGATSYDVYRRSAEADFAKIGSTSMATYTDETVSANSAYLYAVTAIAENESPRSSADLATTVIFTDPTLTPGTTIMKAVHITELRTIAGLVRELASLPPYTFEDADLTAGALARSAHFSDVRAALEQARTALGLPSFFYTEPAVAPGMTIRADHLIELRTAAR